LRLDLQGRDAKYDSVEEHYIQHPLLHFIEDQQELRPKT
jgi:hypothetical protein